MHNEANKNNLFELKPGEKLEALYDKCPQCGCDLTKLPQAFINQIKAQEAKNRSRKIEMAWVARYFRRLSINKAKLYFKRMVFPFAKAEKNTSQRNIK